MTAASRAVNVAPDYVHFDKFIEPDENLELTGTRLKWHNLAREDEPILGEIRDLARAFLERESTAGRLDQLGELGFVILHRCGRDFYFLLVGSWRNENELWETVYAKDGDKQPDFAEWPLAMPHHATFCVWELAAVWHEKQAWTRFLLSARDDHAANAYLEDRYRGGA